MTYFENETALKAVAEGRWAGQVSGSWNIGDSPNGGYLVAFALRAFRELVPEHPDPLSVTTHYLRPGVVDATCEVEAEVVRTGRSLSTVRATLVQDGKARIEVLATLGVLSDADDPNADTGATLTLPPPEMPPPEQCIERSGKEQGVDLPILNRLDILLHPEQAKAGAAGRAEVSGWIRFKDGRPPDSLAAVTLVDAFPPSLLGLIGAVGWVPTIELTVHVRRRPAPGWMLGQFTTNDFREARMIENGALWDADGNLVAQSRQLALLLRRDP